MPAFSVVPVAQAQQQPSTSKRAQLLREYQSFIDLSEDVVLKALSTGMLEGNRPQEIRKAIEIFLTPRRTKAHGRPLYISDAEQCGLNMDLIDVNSREWELIYELHLRTSEYVSTQVGKCIENGKESFVVAAPRSQS